ncbi:MAG: hypothetical protein NVSMB65_15990 [Chloroflexota bacterium]
MATAVSIPWGAWYGDTEHLLTFPEGWRVTVCPMQDAGDAGAAAITDALRRPIGIPSLRELAARRRSAAVVVDDLARPTPAYRLLPILLARIEEGGVPPEKIRLIVGTAARRALVSDDLFKKLGRDVMDRYEILNHQPYENLEDMGTSSRGTPIRVNRSFLDADLRIAVGCIMPQVGIGFGGGAEDIMPGIVGTDTQAWMHEKVGPVASPGDLENSEQRADTEEIVERIGLDLVVDIVPTSKRGIAGAFAGDPVEAHRAGVALARHVFATPLPDDLVDIVVTNAYPRDTDFLQADAALTILESAWRMGNRVLRPGGTTVITTASSEGRGFHALFGSGGRFYTPRSEPVPFDRMHSAGPVYYVPALNPRDADGLPVWTSWDGLLAELGTLHGYRPRVAIFPVGALQLSA